MLGSPLGDHMKDFAKQRGQGLTEYAIILALIVIAIVGVAVTFGDDIRQMFDNSGSTAPATSNAPGSLKPTPSGTGAEAPKKK
jgi:Flp pilus assembly pilin Flp